MTGIAASRMRGGPSPAALPHDTLTHVELTWVEKKIENWIRFGMHAHEQIAGLIYLGTAKENPVERQRPTLSKKVERWTD